MFSFPDCVERACSKIETARSLVEVWRAMAEFVADAGFLHGSYYLSKRTRGADVDAIFFLTYPKAWTEYYIERQYYKIDPVVLEGLRALLPVDWSILDRRSPEVRTLFGEACEHGVGRQGLTAPIRGPNHETAIFSVTSDAPDRDWREASRRLGPWLHFVGHKIHERVVAISERSAGTDPPRITPRELDCLRCCANGLRDREIGKLLDIDGEVVRAHLDRVRQKLTAPTRANAIAQAIELGII